MFKKGKGGSMDLVLDKLYTNINISVDDFLEDSVRDDDPVIKYILYRLANSSEKVDYETLESSTVLTYLKTMEWIYNNMMLVSPKVLVETAPANIKKYVDFIVSGYYGTYFEEDVESLVVDSSERVEFSKSQINI